MGEDLVLLSQFTQVVYTMQLTDVRAFMLMIHFKEYSTNMFLCVQVSMIDQRHAICVQACTKRAFTYCVCTVYTELGCTMVYICLNMTIKSKFLVILISIIWLYSHLVYIGERSKNSHFLDKKNTTRSG